MLLPAPPRLRGRRPLLLAAGLVVVLTLGGVLGFAALADRANGPGTRCDRFSQASLDRRARDADDGSGAGKVAVLGDSWSVGLGLDDPYRSWPSRLPGAVHVDGFSGSGFSADASPCGTRVMYAERADRAVGEGADVLVVEGGLNDWDRTGDEIRTGFAMLASRLERVDVGRVLVVGPAPAPSRLTGAERVDEVLAQQCAAYGYDYLSTIDLDGLTYLSDRLHPTVAGHAAFGDRVAQAVRPLLAGE